MQVSNELLSSLFGGNTAVSSNKLSRAAGEQVTGTVYGFEDTFRNSLHSVKSMETARPSSNYNKSAQEETGTGTTYSYMADEGGFIHYNGVTFVCTENTLCLGDMNDKRNVLIIPLSGGGCLMVNRNNFDGLAKAIGMFSPEDTKRILDAIATDAKTKNKESEVENIINKTYQKISGK